MTSNQTAESSETTVNLEINQEGDFFNQIQKQLSIQLSGLTSVPITFQTVNDDHAEDDGNITINIIRDETYNISEHRKQVMVIISDEVDRNARAAQLTSLTQSFLPNLVTEMGKQNAEILTARTQQKKNKTESVQLKFGGQESIQGILSVSGDALNNKSKSFRSFLGESSFTMPILNGVNVTTPTNIWGIGNHQELSSDSRVNSENWTGELFTGHLGIETLLETGTETGLSYSITEADIEIEVIAGEKIDFTLNSTAINPFIGWSSANGDTNLHAMFGYGFGELGIDQPKYEYAQLKSRSRALTLLEIDSYILQLEF